MNLTRFALAVLAFSLWPASVVFAAPARYVVINVVQGNKLVPNAVITISDRSASPPEHTTIYTKFDGTAQFALWPNAEGEICFQAAMRNDIRLKTQSECFTSHYPSNVTLEFPRSRR